jgi:uncharacterized protein YaaQ
MRRIGHGRDRGLLGGFVEPDRQGQLGIGPIRVLEAHHRAPCPEGRDGGGEERAEALVEVGAVNGGRNPFGERVEGARTFDRVWHRRSPGRRAGTRGAGSRAAGGSYTASRAIRQAPAAPRASGDDPGEPGPARAVPSRPSARTAALCSPRETRRRDRAPRGRRGPRGRIARSDYRATRLASSGGFLKQSNATVILGVDDDHVDAVIDVIRETCTARTQVVNPMPPIMEPGEFFMPYPLEVEVGGATVFVLPVDRFERI